MGTQLDDASASNQLTGDPLLKRVAWRLLPFMCLMYLLAYLDRVNVGFAKLQMIDDLRLNEAIFGLGAGIFFFGYFLFEVPSNLILERVGARRWIGRIMISWGIVAVAMMFVKGTWSFYVLRFLLGIAEAGFFPGMLLYLSFWFPQRWRARMNTAFYTSSALAGVIGGPVSGGLLTMDGIGGLRGWQWLFLIEGIPSILVGILVFFWLTDRPGTAKWLTRDEATWIENEVARERGPAVAHGRLIDALRDYRLWLLISVYFCLNMGGYAAPFWIPTVIKEVTQGSNAHVGWLTAIPFIVAAIAMNLVSRHSDRVGERRLHVAGSLTVAAIGFIWVPFCHNIFTALIALSMCMAGIASAVGPLWAIPGAFLRGTAAAGGIAAINSIGNLGGFLGPYLVGFVRNKYQGFNGGLMAVGFCVFAGALVAALGLREKKTLPSGFEVLPPKATDAPATSAIRPPET